MARIHKLKIKNFRGIEELEHTFSNVNLSCLIGRGDSGKSTILEAIYLALSPNRVETFFDEDFYNCEIENPIEIEVTLRQIPDELMKDGKFVEYFEIFDPVKNTISDKVDTYEPEDRTERVLTIRLNVERDLEPDWTVISSRELEPKPIRYSDRQKLKVFYIADFVDRHFTWSKWNLLHRLLQESGESSDENDQGIREMSRTFKIGLDGMNWSPLQPSTDQIVERARKYGADMQGGSTRIDSKDLFSRDSRFSLHDNKVPFRLKGKGSKRLASIAIQSLLVKAGGVVLIDEVEQSLEPDRARHAVVTLGNEGHGQIILSTHSRDVLVELKPQNVLLARKNADHLTHFETNSETIGALRLNPEAFYGTRIIVCEGKTEIGLCRAIDQFRISQHEKSFAELGIVAAYGEGENTPKNARIINESGFEVVVLCDSEKEKINLEKEQLRKLGIEVFDWENGDLIERAFFRDLPKVALAPLLKETARLLGEKRNISATDAAEDMWAAIEAKFDGDARVEYEKDNPCMEWRMAVADASKGNDNNRKKSPPWYKDINGGQVLGQITFENFSKIAETSLGRSLSALTGWIYPK